MKTVPDNKMPDSPSARILIVDDEAPLMHALCDTLQDHGYETVGFNNGNAALEALEKSKFDLILSDLMMPEISGMEFYDILLRERPLIAERVVFMSGGAFTASARAFLDRVPNERIEKPFNLGQVRDLVQKFVRRVAALRLAEAEIARGRTKS